MPCPLAVPWRYGEARCGHHAPDTRERYHHHGQPARPEPREWRVCQVQNSSAAGIVCASRRRLPPRVPFFRGIPTRLPRPRSAQWRRVVKSNITGFPTQRRSVEWRCLLDRDDTHRMHACSRADLNRIAGSMIQQGTPHGGLVGNPSLRGRRLHWSEDDVRILFSILLDRDSRPDLSHFAGGALDNHRISERTFEVRNPALERRLSNTMYSSRLHTT